MTRRDYLMLVNNLRRLAKQGTRYGMACLLMKDAADTIEQLIAETEDKRKGSQ